MPLNGLAGIRWTRGDLDGARHFWAETLAVGEATRDERSLGYGYSGLGLTALCRGQSAEARRCFEQGAEIFERLGLMAPLAVARVNLVEIHHFTGNLRRGLELADRTLAQARETHHPLGIARGLHHKSLLLVDLGRHAQAREAAEEALAIVRDLGNLEDELVTLVGLLRALWALGDLPEARVRLDEAMGLLDKYDPEGFAAIILAWRARQAAMEGDDATAASELQRALDCNGTRWPYQDCRLDLVLARVYASMGNSAEATRRADSAIRRADACGFRFYALKGHRIAAQHSTDEAAVARHRRVADALARSLAANLAREDSERFLDLEAGIVRVLPSAEVTVAHVRRIGPTP
jgi:tetratricopeptide (TPR) repeat protein